MCGGVCGCAWLCELEEGERGRGVVTNDVAGDPNAPTDGCIGRDGREGGYEWQGKRR